MKMIVAIIPDADHEQVSTSLIAKNFRVTTIASSGGFLRQGSSTLMIGIENDRVDEAIQVIKDACSPPLELGLKRGTLFVLDVERFNQI